PWPDSLGFKRKKQVMLGPEALHTEGQKVLYATDVDEFGALCCLRVGSFTAAGQQEAREGA
ncbi:MAG TPA: hypothetical protein PKZ01_14005, partial [Candidatus Hydrogenedentes bacterium]|nr:hypothetical protein [Candidatus Hydrogenedentota bacterium]